MQMSDVLTQLDQIVAVLPTSSTKNKAAESDEGPSSREPSHAGPSASKADKGKERLEL